MDTAQRQTRDMLISYGATLKRYAGNGNEIWQLPNGTRFVCAGVHARVSASAWHNSKARLQRMLKNLVKPYEPIAVRMPEFTFLAKEHFAPQPEAQQPTKEESMSLDAIQKLPTLKRKDGWTPEHDKIVADGIAAGMDNAEIAVLLQNDRPGTSTHAVYMRRYKHNVTQSSNVPSRGDDAEPIKRRMHHKAGFAEVSFKSAGAERTLTVDIKTARRMLGIVAQL